MTLLKDRCLCYLQPSKMEGNSRYSYTGPIDHTVQIDQSRLLNKSVVITGGANGMGEICVKQFAAAGSYVTFADTNEARGKQVEDEVLKAGGRAQFVRCDVTSWDDQVRMFDAAITNSPNGSCDVVVANAGISRSSGDSLWKLDGMPRFARLDPRLQLTDSTDPNGEPSKPELNIVNVNLNGSLYTFKLATHYFRKQPAGEDRDRCFIITGSVVAYIDSPVRLKLSSIAASRLALIIF